MSDSDRKYNVAIVGLSFGAEFIPIYQAYPHTNLVAICQRSRPKLDAVGDTWGVEKRYSDYAELLKDKDIEAVHINTPPPNHADMCVAGLEAGKHVASTIPMALTVADCKRIVDAQKASGKLYMMMETTVYSREFHYIKQMYAAGELGKLQFFRSSHQQEMAGWPAYWEGFPPMWNATHAIAPTLALGGNEGQSVSCYGSGTIDKRMHANYGSPFAIETVHIKFRDSDLVAEVTRSLFNTARQYRESFDVYGSKKSFEWTQIEGENHIIHTGEKPAASRSPILPISFPGRFRSSQRRECTTARTRNTYPSRRAGDTAGPIPTSCTSSSRRCGRSGSRSPTRGRQRTSPAAGSSPTSRQ